MIGTRFAGGYGIFTGLMMLALWTMLLSTGQMPELQTAPIETGFHLVNETTTALLLIVAGIAVLRNRPWGPPLYRFAAGMLLYASITAGGYYGQAGEPVVTAILLTVAAIGVLCAILVGRGQPTTAPTTGRRRRAG